MRTRRFSLLAAGLLSISPSSFAQEQLAQQKAQPPADPCVCWN
jgi:hypothetical protein